MRLFIIHPGIQHSPRLANGASRSGLFENVTLMTSILFKPTKKVFGLLKKRVKPIDKDIKIINHFIYTFLYTSTSFIYNFIFRNPNNQSHNNPIYFWQQIFGWMCLPVLWLNRKNCMVICFETAGCPVAKYCKKWNIPVVMDFASISHEKAKELGINETAYGISLKLKERALIDYGFYCSDFCRKSFEGLTSAKKDFVLYLGAEASTPLSLTNPTLLNLTQEMQESSPDSYRDKNQDLGVDLIKISFIANLEYRKGLDIFLESIYGYEYSTFLEVHLIGRIREEWVNENMPEQIINSNIKLVYQPAMSQTDLFAYLKKEDFDLNVQCSRFDSFAMVVPETMMQGVPNVVSPFVGAGETLKNDVNGFVMEELSAMCLTSKIRAYINLSKAERLNLKNKVLESSLKMDWRTYYINLAKSLNLILKNIDK